ncbi:hypothetical protein M3Y97_00941900 [Aphelenchoides bicaudatus]|nr:hypothetical protein M3Y97_00941900 [Aphelenchoides bicaudatus]
MLKIATNIFAIPETPPNLFQEAATCQELNVIKLLLNVTLEELVLLAIRPTTATRTVPPPAPINSVTPLPVTTAISNSTTPLPVTTVASNSTTSVQKGPAPMPPRSLCNKFHYKSTIQCYTFFSSHLRTKYRVFAMRGCYDSTFMFAEATSRCNFSLTRAMCNSSNCNTDSLQTTVSSAAPLVLFASSATAPPVSIAPLPGSLLINTNAPSNKGPFKCLQAASSTTSNSSNPANVSLPTLSCSLTSIGCFKFVCLSGMASFTMRGCLDPLQPQFGCQSLNAQCPGTGQCYTCSFGDNCNMDIPTPALPPVVTPPSAAVSAPQASWQCLQQYSSVSSASSNYAPANCSSTATGCFRFVCTSAYSTYSTYTIRGCSDPLQPQLSCQSLAVQCPASSMSQTNQCFFCNSSNNCNTDLAQNPFPAPVTSAPLPLPTSAPISCFQQTFTPSSVAGSMSSLNTSYNANFSSVTCAPGISSCFRFSCTSPICYSGYSSYGSCSTCYGTNCNSNPVLTTTAIPSMPTRATPFKCYQQFIPSPNITLLSPNSSILTQVTCSEYATGCFRFTRPEFGNLTIAGCSDPRQQQYNNCSALLANYHTSGSCYTCNSDLCNTDPPQNVVFSKTPMPVVSTTTRGPFLCLEQKFTPSSVVVSGGSSLFSGSYNTTYPSVTCLPGALACFRATCRSTSTNFDVRGCYSSSMSSELGQYCPNPLSVLSCSTDNCNYDPPVTSTVPTTYVTRATRINCYQKFSAMLNDSQTFSTDSLSLSQVTCASTATGCFTYSCAGTNTSATYMMMGCLDPTQTQYTCQAFTTRCPSARCMTCNGDYCNTDPPKNVISIQEPTTTTPRVPLQCMQQFLRNSSSTGTSTTCSSSSDSCFTYVCNATTANYTLRVVLAPEIATLAVQIIAILISRQRQYTNSSNISGSLESAVTFTTCLESTTGCARFSCPGPSNYTLRGCQQPEMNCQTFLSQCPGGTCYNCAGDLCNDDQISKMTIIPANPSVTMPMLSTTTALTGVARNPQRDDAENKNEGAGQAIGEKDDKFYSSQLNQKYNLFT